MKRLTTAERKSAIETISYIAEGSTDYERGELEKMRDLSDRHTAAIEGLLMVLLDKGFIDPADLEEMY